MEYDRNPSIPFARYVATHSRTVLLPLFPISISAAIPAALASPRRYRSAALTLASTVYFAFLDTNTPPEVHWFVFFQCLLQGEHITIFLLASGCFVYRVLMTSSMTISSARLRILFILPTHSMGCSALSCSVTPSCLTICVIKLSSIAVALPSA